MAKAAELNGYPGPKHVPQLSVKLGLTEIQQRDVQGIFDRMSAAAKPLGGELIAQEQTLDQLFANGEITLDRLATATAAIAELQGRLRAVHLHILWLNGDGLRPLPLGERRRSLQSILPKRSEIVSGPLSVVGRGHELFRLMRAHDLEGIVAKRLHDSYNARVRWLKIKNQHYLQQEGRGELLNGPRRRPTRSAAWW
jgi:hypothetical protein